MPRYLGTPPRFAFALRLTALGAQTGFAFSIALVAADISSQLVPRHAALSFGIAGSTTAILAWRLLDRIFERVGA